LKLLRLNTFPENQIICREIITAGKFIEKLLGLTFKNLKEYQGFLIINCNGIHTFWMRYKIDVLFLDKEDYVIELYESLSPFSMTPTIKKACKVVELTNLTIKKNKIRIGDKLLFLI